MTHSSVLWQIYCESDRLVGAASAITSMERTATDDGTAEMRMIDGLDERQEKEMSNDVLLRREPVVDGVCATWCSTAIPFQGLAAAHPRGLETARAVVQWIASDLNRDDVLQARSRRLPSVAASAHPSTTSDRKIHLTPFRTGRPSCKRHSRP